jgi:hypothetical protein
MKDGSEMTIPESARNVQRDARDAIKKPAILVSITYTSTLRENVLTPVLKDLPMLTTSVLNVQMTSVTTVYQRSQIAVLTVLDHSSMRTNVLTNAPRVTSHQVVSVSNVAQSV